MSSVIAKKATGNSKPISIAPFLDKPAPTTTDIEIIKGSNALLQAQLEHRDGTLYYFCQDVKTLSDNPDLIAEADRLIKQYNLTRLDA